MCKSKGGAVPHPNFCIPTTGKCSLTYSKEKLILLQEFAAFVPELPLADQSENVSGYR